MPEINERPKERASTMTNLNLFNDMINKYNRLSYTHRYVFGFSFKKNVYFVEATAEILPFILTLDKASSKNGGGYSLRFNPTTEQKVFLLSKGAKILCSKEYFDTTTAESKYNKGEIFEKMITEKCGQVWVKDNVPFTNGGDLTVDGIAYQLKFEKATFTNEKFLARF